MIAASSVVKRRFSKDAFTGHGLVGLDNLGNTCYMSSALQCLSHTRLLVEYFKNEAYLRDINLRNRDGTNGKLAVAFGELLRVLWTSDKKRFAPNEFKRVLAKFNPQFTGSDQHDAQELLAFVLSALSEDLNRIMTKPYTEQPDSDGRSDVIVADEWWQNHLKREVSVIVALFTGQYKSLLECSVCHYESARFEPFTFLQLSLPESSFRSILLTIIFNSGRVPMKYSVRVKHNATIQDVKHEVATFLSRELDKGVVTSSGNNAMIETLKTQLVIARISSLHIIDTILDGRTPLSQIHEKDQLTVFQVDPLESVTTLSLHEAPEKALAKINGNASTASSHRSNSIPTDTKDTKKQQNGVHTNGNTRSQASVTDESMEQEGSQSIEDESEEQEAGEPDDANDDEEAEGGDNHADELLPVGTSVFVRGDKAKEYASARVIGSSAKSGTVDVAYPTGNRRYFVPQGKVIVRQSDEAHIYLVHRRVERSTNSFTNAHITRLFGAPLVLRISLRATSTFDLYIAVWKRLRRIFNWQAPPAPTEFDKSTQSDSEAAEHEGHEKLKADASALALGDHLPVTKFGFCLRMVTSHGTGCSRCEWLEGCLGCLILPSPHEPLQLTAEETIAIDWDIRTLKEEYDPIQASKLDFDNSVQHNKRQDNMPLSIEHCMDMFTAKERIQEAYCGRCKTLRPATKTMDLWRLPPLLVIQLKRFCYTQVSRRKLHHLVDFPLRGLQLENFVAKQREPRRMQESGLQYWRFLGGKLKHEEEEHDAVANKEESRDARIEEGDEDESTRPSTNPLSPSRRESTPLLDAPATAAVRGKDGFLYDLYAVVNHVGALGGGHYFAYVLSEKDGKWKCFNDHQCKDIDETEVASSTAYILFYRRRDTQNMSIEELFPPIVPNSTKHGENSGRDPAEESADQAQVEQLLEQSKLASGGSSCIIS
uniref:Ubiquitin carboxyl-terminal hydrolase n=1 Tax=Globisporangium ultimum (strain ATCC 200006 / CBS 805.95 / DAOM BR144) TaxID=431595 RepID=K3WLF0_GLOUD